METKFTKGPWKSFKNSAGMFEVCCQDMCDANADDICIYSATVCVVCNVTYALDENKDPEKNAHLIAAAPEMYEMLDQLSDLDECQMFKGEIKALLAKARGENV